MTSWFSIRKQPDDAAQPMLDGVLVPWMRYPESRPPK
jgi:hypothetical protein